MRILILVLLAACGGKSQEPAKPIANVTPAGAKPTCTKGPECTISFVGYFATEVCKCTDLACANRVNEDFIAWGRANADANRDEELSADGSQPLAEAQTRYVECFTKLAMAGSGGAP